jgi:DNA polymerase-3 subunit alpha
MVEAARADGQTAMAITDHGTCAGHPAFQLACDEAGIKPIFGMEAYFVNDRLVPGESNNDYWHLILLAMDDEGLRNLWAMSTESYRDGFWGKPRIDWDTLQRLNKGVMATTACLGGPVIGPYSKGDEPQAIANLLRLKEIFGDRLYAEIHVNHLDEQLRANDWLVETCETYQVQPIAVVDSHYAHKEDQHTHQVWLSMQTNKDIADESSLFGGGQDYHLMNEEEVRGSLHYLPPEFVEAAIVNTVLLADRCTAKIEKRSHNPVYSRITPEYPDPIAHDCDRLLDVCMERWLERTGGKSYGHEVYEERFAKEYSMIVDKGFAGYFLMVWDMVAYAKKNGVLVGPARGSGGGSLVAYLLGITELDPVEYDVLFERFMTKGRVELPDFDIDFPKSKKKMMFEYVADRWGADHVATVGTHMRMKNKSVIQSVARAIKSTLPHDYWETMVIPVSALIDEAEAGTAGLGLSWEQLWIQTGDLLDPYKDKYPDVFKLAEQMIGRLKTYGKHPAGVIIDPDASLVSNLPLRSGEDGQMVAQFDLQILDLLGYTKFDMLNLRNLDTLQMTVDLIYEKTGRRVDPYGWREELKDPYVYEQISEGWTLGLFQVETKTGTTMSKRFHPSHLVDLADILTLVRPGPKRSGLTDQYLRRRNGAEEVTYADPRMEKILAKTQGTLLYQEQLMSLCMELAGYDDVQADWVRKILGKKKVALAKLEGPKFVAAAVANGTDETVAQDLWNQMEEFAKYSFGYGHAMGYAILTLWTAWFKYHYPLYFLTAALSTVKPEMIPPFIEESRRIGYKVLPPDINESGEGFSIDSTMLGVRYGIEAIDGIGPVALQAVLQAQPYNSWEDFLERKGEKCNAGHVKTLVKIGVFDSLVPNRRWLESTLEHEALIGSVAGCAFKSEVTNEHNLLCSFDWASEEAPIGRTGKPMKAKPPPKKCTRGCRHFTPVLPPTPDQVTVYTDEEIRDIETALIGVYLSSTPFDRIPAEDRENLATALDLLAGPNGNYMCAVIVNGVRLKNDKKGNPMAFLTLGTERGGFDCTVFASTYPKYANDFKVGSLAYVSVNKNDIGQTLDVFLSLDD